MRSVRCAIGIAAALGAACESPKQAPATQPEAEKRVMVGISPPEFRCDILATDEQMAELLGAPTRRVESAATSSNGMASPCNYLTTRAGAAALEAWTFDMDCRDNMLTRANALFEQYERTSAELVGMAANVKADPEAARPVRNPAPGASEPSSPPSPPSGSKPELARPVDVGARGLDHHGQGLLFIDDDAPCYVRVGGPDGERRLALARPLVTARKPATAPMSPRPAPRP